MESGNQTARTAKFALGGAVAILVASIAYGAMGGGPAPKADPTPVSGQVTIESLQDRVKASPDDARGWAALGEAYYVRDDFPQAIAAYERATAIDAKAPGFWSALGEARVMASPRDPMPAAALDAFRKALALDAKDPRARYFLAVKRDLDGDHKGAVEDWLALLADTPPGASWERDLRRTIEQVARINKIDVASRIAKIRPPVAEKQGLPHDFAAQGIPGPSAEQIDAAKALTPGQQNEMVAGMVGRLEDRLKREPNDLKGWVMLMRSRVMLGETAKAQAALRAAVKANPGAKAELEAQAAGLGIGP